MICHNYNIASRNCQAETQSVSKLEDKIKSLVKKWKISVILNLNSELH